MKIFGRILSAFLLSFPLAASAVSVDWSGTYRFELIQVDRPSLSSPSQRKAYGLNYLGLRPRIIASDGVEIVGKFDVLANQDPAYQNSQAGQLWGQSLRSGTDPYANPAPGNSDTQSQTKQSTFMTVRELYLNVNQEYGSLLVGRAPYEFGLGIVWNAGNGAFDHWTTSSDVVAYKFIVGNLSFLPMVGRVAAEGTGAAEVVQDETIQVLYESEESGSMIGAVMNRRKSSAGSSNDAFVPGGTKNGAYSMQTNSFVLGRTWSGFNFKLEGGFTSGDYGYVSTGGENIRNNSYGFALEMGFPRPESKWDFRLRAGVASGDDPTTADIESFQFNRNYDVAMLMFNHRLGGFNILQTGAIKSAAKGLDDSIDDEAISNASYISPKIGYAWSEKLDFNNTFTYAQLMTNPNNSVDFKKDLGLEWDMELVYKPRTNVRWVNELGLLFPGQAFKDGAANRDNGFTFGIATKAAITF